jgi:hypothetical protein
MVSKIVWKILLNKNKTQKLTTFMRVIKNCFAVRGLPIPALYYELFFYLFNKYYFSDTIFYQCDCLRFFFSFFLIKTFFAFYFWQKLKWRHCVRSVLRR